MTDTKIVGEYYRNQKGDVVHLAPCPRLGSAVRWTYADGMGLREVAATVAGIEWLRLCRSCWPAEALNGGMTP